MVTYEISKLRFGKKEFIAYGDLVDHIAERLLDQDIRGILKHNSDGYCERNARMSDRRKAATIARDQLFAHGWVQIADQGYTSDGFADDAFFDLEIRRVKE